jgi:hypothetical protein
MELVTLQFWLWIIVVCIRLIVRPDRWSNAAR